MKMLARIEFNGLIMPPDATGTIGTLGHPTPGPSLPVSIIEGVSARPGTRFITDQEYRMAMATCSDIAHGLDCGVT